MAIECVSAKKDKVKRRQKYWIEEEEYERQNPETSEKVDVREGGFFRIRFLGNMKEVGGHETFEMTYQKSRDNFHVFNCMVTEKGQDVMATVAIERGHRETEEKEVIMTTNVLCFPKQEIIKEKIVREKYEDLLTMPMLVTNPYEETEAEKRYNDQISKKEEDSGYEKEEKQKAEKKAEQRQEEQITTKEEDNGKKDLKADEKAEKYLDEQVTEEDNTEQEEETEEIAMKFSDDQEGNDNTEELRRELESATETEEEEEREREKRERAIYNIPENVDLAKPVILPSSLANLCRKLSKQEVRFLPVQLNIEVKKTMQISEARNPHKELEHLLIEHFKGSVPVRKIKHLIRSLRSINRTDLADQVQHALDNDLPIPH